MVTATSIFAANAAAAALTNCQHVRSVGETAKLPKGIAEDDDTVCMSTARFAFATAASKVDIIPHDTWYALCRGGRTFAGWGCGPPRSSPPNNIAGYKKWSRKVGRRNAKVVICERRAFGERSDIVPLLLSR